MSTENKIVLEMQNVEKNFGGVRAIDNFSVKIEHGKIHGLIGPNGAGKTTIFNNITGIYKPNAGKIIFDGTDITGGNRLLNSKPGSVIVPKLVSLLITHEGSLSL